MSTMLWGLIGLWLVLNGMIAVFLVWRRRQPDRRRASHAVFGAFSGFEDGSAGSLIRTSFFPQRRISRCDRKGECRRLLPDQIMHIPLAAARLAETQAATLHHPRWHFQRARPA